MKKYLSTLVMLLTIVSAFANSKNIVPGYADQVPNLKPECDAPIPIVQQSEFDILYAYLRENCRIILDRFCYDFYYAQFNKVYKQGSIYVSEMNMNQNTGTIYAKGVHNYYGKSYGFGRKEHQGVPFLAHFTILQTGIRVVFQKWYEPDVLHPNGGWEKIDKIVPFDYGSR